jgi:hypothetical protein
MLSDLAHLTTPPRSPNKNEEYDMLSIVVNDALIGINIMEKYPAFYARMLVDEELRTAFLDTLEMLESGDEESLPDFPEVTLVNLDFIRRVMSRPVILSMTPNRLELIWKRTAKQLHTLFYINSLKSREVLRSDDYLPGGGQLNILESQVQVGEDELEMRLEAEHALENPGHLNLTIAINIADDFSPRLEATIVWGGYSETAVVSQFGIANFPPLNTDEIIARNGALRHGLELRLEQVE